MNVVTTTVQTINFVGKRTSFSQMSHYPKSLNLVESIKLIWPECRNSLATSKQIEHQHKIVAPQISHRSRLVTYISNKYVQNYHNYA